MPAYAVAIGRWTCTDSSCQMIATMMVRNTRNEDVGRYCDRHANAMVARLNKEDDDHG